MENILKVFEETSARVWGTVVTVGSYATGKGVKELDQVVPVIHPLEKVAYAVSIVVGVITFISYIYRFVKWCKNKINQRKQLKEQIKTEES